MNPATSTLITTLFFALAMVSNCAPRKPLVLNVNNQNSFNINQARQIIEKNKKRNKIREKQSEKARREKNELERKLSKQLKKHHVSRVYEKKQVPCIGCSY